MSRYIFWGVAALLIAGMLHAQPSFMMLAADPAGDMIQSSTLDVKSLSYAVSLEQDSLWVRIETYDKRAPKGDMGYAIGLDIDDNLTNGLTWGGQTSSNSSMKPDLICSISRNIIFPDAVSVTVSNNPGNPVKPSIGAREIDDYTLEVGMKLSDLQSPGMIHVVAGSGSFDIGTHANTHDDVPDNSFATIVLPTNSVGENLENPYQMNITPQPVSEGGRVSFELKQTHAVSLVVCDALGRIVATLFTGIKEAGRHSLPLGAERLQPGVYYAILRTASESSAHIPIVVW